MSESVMYYTPNTRREALLMRHAAQNALDAFWLHHAIPISTGIKAAHKDLHRSMVERYPIPTRKVRRVEPDPHIPELMEWAAQDRANVDTGEVEVNVVAQRGYLDDSNTFIITPKRLALINDLAALQ